MSLFKFSSTKSLRFKILSGMMLSLIPMLIIVVIFYNSSSKKTLEDSKRIMMLIGQYATKNINEYFLAQKGAFLNWTQEDVYGMAIEFQTLEELSGHFESLLKDQKGVGLLCLTDKSGQILQASVSDSITELNAAALIGQQVEGISNFDRGAERATIHMDNNITRGMGRCPTAEVFGYKTKNMDGNHNGYLLAFLDSQNLQDLVETSFTELKANGFEQASMAFMNTQSTDILAHSNPAMIGQTMKVDDAQHAILLDDHNKTQKWDHDGEVEYLALSPIYDVTSIFDSTDTGRELSHLCVASFVPEQEIIAELEGILWTSISIAVVSGILIFLTGYFMVIQIARPMQHAVALANDIKQGDLSNRMELKTSTLEIANLARALDSMVESLGNKANLAGTIAKGDLTADVHLDSEKDVLGRALRDMTGSLCDVIGQINDATHQFNSVSSQVKDSSQGLSQSASECAASVEEITSSTTVFSDQTRQNAENANLANELAHQTLNLAENGNSQMKEMESAMDEINTSSSEIAQIIKVIDNIAFQTNLLALNAAVEAARAGKYGKGFAVVAEEVRTLAARSAKAAKETSELIDGSNKCVSRGTEIVTKTSKALSEIVESVKKTTDLVGEIASSNNEQASRIEQINIGLGQIDQATQHNTARSEETASAAELLASQSVDLRQTLSRFILPQGNAISDESDYSASPSTWSNEQAQPSSTEENNAVETCASGWDKV